MENTKAEVREKIKEAQKVLIGIGKEWALRDDEKDIRFRHLSDPAQSDLKAAYEELYQLIQDKDYYIVTTLTDGAIYEMPFDKNRIVAPCGNIHWRQCSKACTKDIWDWEEYVRIAETEGDYNTGAYVYQEYVEPTAYSGRYPVIGSWIIGGEAAGIGIRENRMEVTDNLSEFVPHIIG